MVEHCVPFLGFFLNTFHSVRFHDLTLHVPHIKTLCLGLWAAHFLDQDTDIMSLCKLKSHYLQTSLQLFLQCHQMKKYEKLFWWVFFNLSPAFGMICHNKNVRFMMQNPSLGSLTEDPIDTSENLMLIQRFGQELSIYICFS